MWFGKFQRQVATAPRVSEARFRRYKQVLRKAKEERKLGDTFGLAELNRNFISISVNAANLVISKSQSRRAAWAACRVTTLVASLALKPQSRYTVQLTRLCNFNTIQFIEQGFLVEFHQSLHGA